MINLKNPLLISPQLKIAGKSQAKRGDEWWQYAVSIPKEAQNPFESNPFASTDETDSNGKRGSINKALNGQSGPVFLIGGSFADAPLTGGTRTIIVPKGFKFIFFPLLNADSNNVAEETPLTVQELRDRLAAQLNSTAEGGFVKSLNLAINRRPITSDLFAQRQQSPEPFSYTVPLGNNVLGLLGQDILNNPIEDLPFIVAGDKFSGSKTLSQLKGEVFPIVADGYLAALPSLFPGKILKTISFGGTVQFPDGTTFSPDITYNILNEVKGTDGKDRLRGTPGKDYIDGRGSNDLITGQGGDDVIVGGDGNDVIDGGWGNDELWGDGSVDRFVFKPGYGMDIIFDFELQNGEKIDISAFGFTSTDDFFNSVSISDLPTGSRPFEGTQIDFQDTVPGVDDQLILRNITSTEITGDAFII